MTVETAEQQEHDGTADCGVWPIHVPSHIVQALTHLLEFRDRKTADHCKDVARVARALASPTVPPPYHAALDAAARLHDLGKAAMPDALLVKCGPLSSVDWDTIREYTWMGVNLVSAVLPCAAVGSILIRHAVWLRGSVSEPADADEGEASVVAAAAAVLAVADAYSSMTTEYPYRKARTPQTALRELRGEPTRFRPDLVEQLAAHVEKESEGISPPDRMHIRRALDQLSGALMAWDPEQFGLLLFRLRNSLPSDRPADLELRVTHLQDALADEADLSKAVLIISEIREMVA